MEWANLSQHRQFSPDKMTKNSLFNAAGMFCDLYCFEPGQEQNIHIHDTSSKVYVVIDGQAHLTIGTEERDLQVGETVLVRPGVTHGVANLSTERLSVLVFMTHTP